jgi:DNA-binding response OmpR family regulator
MKRVLVIDDDQGLLELLSEVLTEASFEPVLATTGQEGIQKAVQVSPNLILLDINLPGMNGLEVCRRLREQPSTRDIPIVMLTTADLVDDRVRGLEVGADDYLPKPFHSKELIARINARLRRAEIATIKDRELKLGNLWMNPVSLETKLADEPIRLTHFEFDLLRYFVERPNQVIARAKLLGDLWPDSVVTDRTVDTHIANLRRKLAGFDHSIQTVYGAGYVLRVTGSSPSAE